MTELVELVEFLLTVSLWVVISFLIVILRLRAKFNNLSYRFAILLAFAALVAIEVGLLTLHCLTGKSYAFNFFLVFIWLYWLVTCACRMSNQKFF